MEVSIMALINCPECNKEINDSAKSCPHCGYKFKNSVWMKIWSKRLIIIGAISAICSLIYSCATADSSLQARAYALTHNGYYSPQYQISSFLSDLFFNGGLLLFCIGIILLIVYKKNSKPN